MLEVQSVTVTKSQVDGEIEIITNFEHPLSALNFDPFTTLNLGLTSDGPPRKLSPFLNSKPNKIVRKQHISDKIHRFNACWEGAWEPEEAVRRLFLAGKIFHVLCFLAWVCVFKGL